MLHLTEWADYRAIDPRGAARDRWRSPVLIDGRCTLDAAAWRAAGWTVRSGTAISLFPAASGSHPACIRPLAGVPVKSGGGLIVGGLWFRSSAGFLKSLPRIFA